MLPALFVWYALGDLPCPEADAAESAALIMLAAGLLVFRTFRERYLLVWIVGWLAYFVASGLPPARTASAVSRYARPSRRRNSCWLSALFAAAILLYATPRKYVASVCSFSFGT